MSNVHSKNSIKYKTELVPVDSEHFSIKELINNYSPEQIEKIFITASGGPFLNLKINKFKNIKSKEATKHPKWKMGKKISVDSATLMNKVARYCLRCACPASPSKRSQAVSARQRRVSK